ncbi:MAG: ATP synthase F1 subunit delta [Ktedonobacterales bacterium]
MLKGATARRYAEAVFQLAKEQSAVDRWRDDLRTVAEYFANKRLLFVLSEPKIAATRKEQMVRDLLAAKVQPEALNLALLLVERGLAALGPAISQAYDQRYNDYRGIAVAQVTTAMVLDDALRQQITAELAKITGKRIELHERVDPAILGGALARVGDTLIDGSLRRRFELLRGQIAVGTLGGPDDGSLAGILGPDGAGAGGAQGAAGGTPPFVVRPAVEGDEPPAGGSDGASSATDMAPRTAGGAHLEPRPPSPGTRGNPGGGNPGGGNPGGRRANKRRRR